MAYSTPSNKNVGDLITAAIWNQDLVANLKASAPDAFAAKGDLFAATGPDAGARVAVGTNGKLLVADSTQGAGLGWKSLVASRMGHHATDWYNNGEYPATPVTDYPTNIMIQVGELDLVGTGAQSAGGTINFPIAFAGKPLIYVNVYNGLEHIYAAGGAADASSAEVRIWVDDGETIPNGSTRSVQWLAIGPA